MLFTDYYIFLEFDGGDADLDDGEPSHYMYVTRGTVAGLDEQDQKIVAGRFRLTYIDVCAAMNAGASVFDIFDNTQETCDYFPAIFDIETLDPSPELMRLFREDMWPGNVLILDRLEILPEFRGHNLGLVVMRRLIERFGAGAGIVAIKPFPLQCELAGKEEDEWRQKMRLDDFEQSLPRATARLRRHYAKLGFKLMKGTPYMFRNAGVALPPPQKLVANTVRL
jgi:GNAT superfamily N-acetyltransferase